MVLNLDKEDLDVILGVMDYAIADYNLEPQPVLSDESAFKRALSIRSQIFTSIDDDI